MNDSSAESATTSRPPESMGETASEPSEPESRRSGQNGHSETIDRPGLFSRVFGSLKARTPGSLRADLTDALSLEADDTEGFSVAERAMLNNILSLREVRVDDVMVPRGDIRAVDLATPLGEVMAQFEESGHSRMPVYAEMLDDPRGMVHLRDVMSHLVRNGRAKGTRDQANPAVDLTAIDLDLPIGELGLVRPILFVPPSMPAGDLMARMQTARIQIALVIDEYGGTDGLVSLEDIVEKVVGDIEDEHDEDEEPLITKRAEGIFLVDAKAEIEDVSEAIGPDFTVDEELLEDVYTVGGLIFNALARIPARGEVVQAVPGWEFHVIDADPRRIKRVRIVRLRADRRRRSQPVAETPAAGVERPASLQD